MCARRSDVRAWLGASTAVLLLCACAQVPVDPQARLARYRDHAGSPVAGIDYVRNMRWEALGDQALAVWPRRDSGFLIQMASPCPGLDKARAIQITQLDGRIRTRVDGVRVLSMPGSRPMQRAPCPILLIRPIADAARGADDHADLPEIAP